MQNFFKKKVNLKEALIILTLAVILLAPLTTLTGNASIKTWGGTNAPGEPDKTSKMYIDKGDYISTRENSHCAKVKGHALKIGHEYIILGVPVKVISVADDVILISVNGAKRAMELGWEKYVAGFSVTVFTATENDACIIIQK